MKRELHGEPGHLNVAIRDHDSVITAKGKHARVVAFLPTGSELYARVDMVWPGLREPTPAEILTVARKDQDVRGRWTLDRTARWQNRGTDRIDVYFKRA